MVKNTCVPSNRGILVEILPLTLWFYHRGTYLNPINIFSPLNMIVGRLNGLDAFVLFFKLSIRHSPPIKEDARLHVDVSIHVVITHGNRHLANR